MGCALVACFWGWMESSVVESSVVESSVMELRVGVDVGFLGLGVFGGVGDGRGQLATRGRVRESTGDGGVLARRRIVFKHWSVAPSSSPKSES